MSYKNIIILPFLVIFLLCQAKVGICVEKETIPFLSDRAFNHAPSILKLSDGTLLVAWNSGSKEKSRDNAILLSLKKPDSNQWSIPQILIDTPDKADGNPVVFLLGNEIYCFYSVLWGSGWSTAQLFYTKSKSDDNNFLWTSPNRVFSFYRMGDLGRGKPIVLNDKEFILPLYKEFMGYYSYICKLKGGEMVYHSPLIKSKPGNLQPAVVALSDGRFIMLMRPEKKGCFWQSFSKDEGLTWSKAVKREDLFNPGSGFDLLRLASGRIAIVFNNDLKNRTNLAIALSEDEGQSFPIRKVLEEEKGIDCAYPSMLQDWKGRIHIVYSVNKKEIRHIVLDEKEIFEDRKL